ncbi:MAG: hypothetical protein Fues2KO_30330 [Fuerstiella sp.]
MWNSVGRRLVVAADRDALARHIGQSSADVAEVSQDAISIDRMAKAVRGGIRHYSMKTIVRIAMSF